MKRWQRMLQWTAWNAVTIACLWFGYREHIEGALNVGLFLVWVHAIVGLCYVAPSIKKVIRERGSVIPIWLQLLAVEIPILALLVWHGAWATGTAQLVHLVLLSFAHAKEPAPPGVIDL